VICRSDIGYEIVDVGIKPDVVASWMIVFWSDEISKAYGLNVMGSKVRRLEDR
jgi:hypothetical protein